MEQVRNLYKGEVDFQALALQSADFAKQYAQNPRDHQQGSKQLQLETKQTN